MVSVSWFENSPLPAVGGKEHGAGGSKRVQSDENQRTQDPEHFRRYVIVDTKRKKDAMKKIEVFAAEKKGRV